MSLFYIDKKFFKWLFLTISITIIMVICDIFFIFKFEPPALQENRLLVTKPELPESMAEWKSYVDQVDGYITDHFPPRAYFIGYVNFLRYLMGYSGSSKVFVGREGWLFYNNGTNMALAAGVQKTDPPNLALWVKGLQQRIAYTEEKNIKFYMLLAPVKESIFPEMRPSWMPQKVVRTEVDDFLNESSLVNIDRIVDPRSSLISAKGSGIQIWHKYDTHWTGLGGYEAYAALMKRISKDFPDLTELPITSFVEQVDLPTTRMPRDLALMLGIAGFVKHSTVSYQTLPIHDPNRTVFLSERKDWTAPQIITTNSPSGKTLLLMRDSFSSELLPFLKAHFTTIIVTHVQDGFFRKDIIDKYNPDIVVLEVIESSARFSMDAF